MRIKLGGFAAFCVGATLIVSCGGGGGGGTIDDTGSSDVAGASGAQGGAPKNAGGGSGGAGSQTASGTAQATAAGGTTPAAGATTPAATGTAPAAGGTPPAATGTTPAATDAAPAATAATPAAAATAPAAATPASAAPAAAPASSAAGTIVPLYTPPSDPSWALVAGAKAAHPRVNVIAVVNPANGPGGGMNSAYAVGIQKLTAAGVKVLGYVATGYGANAAANVKADIDRWQNFYPGQLGGIFFDEQSNKPEQVGYYRDISQYAKSKGLSFTVGNPGTDTAESYVGALDVMLIYESAGVPSAAAMGGWHAKYAPTNFGVIPYASAIDAAFVRSARQYVGYVYVQNDTLPNPWDSVPANFADLLAALE